MLNKINLLLAFIMLQSLAISYANAAFCSLRDPVSAIQMLYAQGYEYRSIVASITDEDRLAVKEKLSFTLHQSEVGKHTLYIIYKDQKHAGFLQARSEWARWGLVEIAWGINLDRTIKGFYFQRCRSPECNDNTVKSINSVLQGKSFSELQALLSESGDSLSPAGEAVFKVAPQLALLTLHSALKTLAITDISWKNDLKEITHIDD